MNTVPPHVRLANDVAAQFAHWPVEDGARAVAAHLRMFWEPRMRAALLAHREAGAAGLAEIAQRAADLLAAPVRDRASERMSRRRSDAPAERSGGVR